VSLPDSFLIRAHVADFEAIVADYGDASANTRAAFPERRTVNYGGGPDEVLDLYLPAVKQPGQGLRQRLRPIHLFVHGGYWRAFSKDDYAFVADAITAAGAIAAIMDYSLMPAARLEVLVGQVRRAASCLAVEAESFGGDAQALSASGHSAGAHLASFLACRGPHESERLPTPARSVLLVSGLYNLDPITRSFLQPELQLTDEEVALWSPLNAAPSPGASITLLVGGRETAPFHEQAAAFVQHLDQAGTPGRLATVQGEDHMTIVRELGRPGSPCARFLAETILASQA